MLGQDSRVALPRLLQPGARETVAEHPVAFVEHRIGGFPHERVPEGELGLAGVPALPTRGDELALDEEGPALKAAPWNLPSEAVQALLFERRGTGAAAHDVLWAGTRDGLIRYDVTQDIATRFGTEDGLPANNLRSLVRAPDGTRYLGTALGVASYAGP